MATNAGMKKKFSFSDAAGVGYFFVLLILAVYFLSYLYHAGKVVFFPYPLEYGEGVTINLARLLQQGKNIYHDLNQRPYLHAPYPPVFPLLAAGLFSITGVTFAAGRLLSTVSALLLGAIIFSVVRRKTGGVLFPAVSALLYFAVNYVYLWSSLFRVDMTAVLFSALGIYLLDRQETPKGAYLAVFFLALALYTKQTMISAPLAAFIWLFRKKGKAGLPVLAFFLLLVLGAFFLLNGVSRGQFLNHMLKYSILSPDPKNLLNQLRGAAATYFVIWGAAVYYLANDFREEKTMLFNLYFSLAAVTAAGSLFKTGADSNHLLEPMLVGCIITGFALGRIGRKQAMVPALLIVQLLTIFHLPYYREAPHVYADFSPPSIDFNQTPGSGDVENGRYVSGYIKAAAGKILAENVGYLVINNREVELEPFQFKQLARMGKWNEKPVLDELKDGKYTLIILESPVEEASPNSMFSREILRQIAAGYRYVDKRGRYFIYMPND